MSVKTIKDIAKAANVSYSTVSRAVNNRPGVREETRRRVLDLAEALEYRPNGPARSLVSRKTYTIGLIIPDITNPFFPELARAIEERAQDSGYSLVLCNTGWDEGKERRFIEMMAERRVDGILIAPSAHAAEQLDRELERINLPMVYVGHAPAGTRRRYVVMDDTSGGRIATEHLLDQGVRTIGFIGATDESVSIQARLSGFREACRSRGFPEERQVVTLEEFRGSSGYDVVERLLDWEKCPEALFCENDVLALGVLDAARTRGIRVPEELLVIGFDDIPFARLQAFGLSTIAQPKREMGRLAVEILLSAMGSEDPIDASQALLAGSDLGRLETQGGQVVLQPTLVTRTTSLRMTGARRS